ncbi:MAG: hypothetical protein Q9222_006387 [Ikaeria aurantiellina]
MRFDRHLTVGLNLSGLLPGESVAPRMSPMQLNTSRTNLLKADPLAKRGKNHFCSEDAEFFNPTLKTWRASNAGEKYIEAAREMVTSPSWGIKSEAALFAQKYMGDLDFDCGISYKGCRPTPYHGDKDEARWVYFVLRSMHYTTLVSGVINEQTLTTEVDLSLEAESAARTFTWKYDEAVAAKCKLLSDLAKAAIIGALVFLAAIVPEIAPAIAGILPGIDATAAETSAFLDSIGKGGQTLVGFATSFPTTVGGDAIQQSICKHFANPDKGLTEATKRAIKQQIDGFYAEYRALIQTTNDLLINGSTTSLASDMKQYYRNALISTLLKNQLCFIECHPYPDDSSKPDVTSAHKKGRHSGIPCMCGNEFGRETNDFWEAASFDTWSNAKVGNWATKKGPQYLCKNDMSIARTYPVAYFINLCYMGWRWPTKLDRAENKGARWLHRGPDIHCKEFITETLNRRESLDTPSPDENCYMWFKSEVGQRIQEGPESQLKEIDNQWYKPGIHGSKHKQNYNFKRACKLYEDEELGQKCYP